MMGLAEMIHNDVITNLKGKDLLSLWDLSSKEIESLIALALELKKGDTLHFQPLAGKTLGMIFEKHSTRTRVSFEVGMYQLGGHALFLSNQDIQLGRGESIPDTARVLSEYVNGIMIRTFEQQKIIQLAEYASVPVINGLSDDYHPCQALADLLTIYELKGRMKDISLAYIGDGNNVAHSLIIVATKMGMNIRVATPPSYEPNEWVVKKAKELAKQTGATILITHDPYEAVKGVDVVYTDVWASMGQEDENDIRKQIFSPYQVNGPLMSIANKDAIFLHCLPAHRGEEVTSDVIDGPQSKVFHQAGNRLHVQKALLVALLGD
jgi:ornithine carbamoyltransferase